MKFYAVRFKYTNSITEYFGTEHFWFDASTYHCCAKYLSDASHYSTLKQAREVKDIIKDTPNVSNVKIYKFCGTEVK